MNSKTINVPNISCGHCVQTIQTEVSELAGVTKVTASADSKQVSIEWNEPATWEGIESLMQEIDFPPVAA
ncbi:MAG: copper chaperone [Cellvibrionaceae bacterium]|jgi:copper chaperone